MKSEKKKKETIVNLSGNTIVQTGNSFLDLLANFPQRETC